MTYFSNTFSTLALSQYVYAEVLCVSENTSSGKGLLAIGVSDSALLSAPGNAVGNTPSPPYFTSVGWYSDGSTLSGNLHVGGDYIPFSAGDWLGIAVNNIANTLWLRNITQGGTWTSVSFAPSGNFYLVVSAAIVGDSMTANFAGPFLSVLPTADPWTCWDGTAVFLSGLHATESHDTAAFVGNVSVASITGVLSATERGDTARFIAPSGLFKAIIGRGEFIDVPAENRLLSVIEDECKLKVRADSSVIALNAYGSCRL